VRLAQKNREGATQDFEKAAELEPGWKAELDGLLAGKPAGGAGPSGTPGRPPPAAPVPKGPAPPIDWKKLKSGLAACLIWTVALVGLGLSGIPILGDLPRRALDGPYKAAWVVAHWSDPLHSPKGKNLCMEPFCVRMDTTHKYVGGHKGYTSQVDYHFCPDHSPHFLSLGLRMDGTIYVAYWVLVLVASALIFAPPIAFLSRLLLWPVLVPLVAFRKTGSSILLPGTGNWMLGVLGVLAAWLVFAIW
jgi:hypothetical protein